MWATRAYCLRHFLMRKDVEEIPFIVHSSLLRAAYEQPVRPD
jgi:hypothetical protein